MSKGKNFSDIKVRLAIFGNKLKIENASGWLKYMGYENESSVSRVVNGKTPISNTSINNICAAVGLDSSDFSISPNELGQKLGIPSNAIHDMIRENTSLQATNNILDMDREIIDIISGRYAMMYLGVDMFNSDYRYVVVEELRFDNADSADATLRVQQLKNYVNGEHVYGTLVSRSHRITIRLSYKMSQYPDSIIILTPHYVGNKNTVFSGLYTDVTAVPKMRIFSTRVVIFEIPDNVILPRKFEDGDNIYDKWMSVLENQVADGSRLYAPMGEEYVEAMISAINATKASHKMI